MHGLKGTGGLFGLPAISESAARVERLLHEERALEEVACEVEMLISMIRRVEGYEVAREGSSRWSACGVQRSRQRADKDLS